jgi:hypothetical protein
MSTVDYYEPAQHWYRATILGGGRGEKLAEEMRHLKVIAN